MFASKKHIAFVWKMVTCMKCTSKWCMKQKDVMLISWQLWLTKDAEIEKKEKAQILWMWFYFSNLFLKMFSLLSWIMQTTFNCLMHLLKLVTYPCSTTYPYSTNVALVFSYQVCSVPYSSVGQLSIIFQKGISNNV